MENERSWDGHANIAGNHTGFAAETDQPIAALLTDLAERGMLDETLVIWGGEFGRLPLVQKGGTGRDHNPHAFTTWFAGGGVKSGTLFGETDEIGHKALVDRVSINDLHATILHQLGLQSRTVDLSLCRSRFPLDGCQWSSRHEILKTPAIPIDRIWWFAATVRALPAGSITFQQAFSHAITMGGLLTQLRMDWFVHRLA